MITKLRLSLLRMRLATPVERIGFLTLTFAPGTTDQEATAEFSAITRPLNSLFQGRWVRVVTLSPSGHVHIHAIVIADRDIQGGFNNEAYEEMRELNEQPVALTPAEKQRRDHLGQILTTNPELKRLWDALRDMIANRRTSTPGKRRLAPRFELCPVRTNAERVSNYFAGNCEEIAACPVSSPLPGCHSNRTKGTRIIAYGKAFPRVLIVPRGRSWIRFQERLGVVLHGLNMPKEFMKIRFGRRWCFYVRYFVFPILIERFGPDMAAWPSDEVGAITSRELARFDRWLYTGPSRDLIAWRTAPGWRELGYSSHEDYVLSMVSNDMSGPSMPLPAPGKKTREKNKVPCDRPVFDPDDPGTRLQRLLEEQFARRFNLDLALVRSGQLDLAGISRSSPIIWNRSPGQP